MLHQDSNLDSSEPKPAVLPLHYEANKKIVLPINTIKYISIG